MENPGSWARDAIERIVRTVVQLVIAAALAAFTKEIQGADVVTLDTVGVALMAAYAAGAAALMAWLAKFKDNTLSPASVVSPS